MLFDRFQDFLVNSCNIISGQKILLAVSGGIDSVVMLQLFSNAGIQCAVAHCNFQLRGDDSDGDEKFVQDIARQNNFQFHVARFNTAEVAVSNKISIQMAARQLRYEWLNKLAEENMYDAVAVAHHANDVAETMLLNLVKGTGLAGMHGIRAVHGKIIRPLLFATKEELVHFAEANGIVWREDASNSAVHYQRNLIRNKVMPVLAQINPGLTNAMLQHARLMKGYEAILEKFISEMGNEIILTSSTGVFRTLDLVKIKSTPDPEIVLYHFLSFCEATGSLCEQILSSTQSGAVFYSGAFKLVRDRDVLTVFEHELRTHESFFLNENEKSFRLPYGKLEVTLINVENPRGIDEIAGFSDPQAAFIDQSLLKFPLELRRWREGDSFQPLGMKGRKLLSDFFIDSKFTSGMKEIVFLLLSEGEVVWVIGHRISERYKIRETTRCIYKINFIQD